MGSSERLKRTKWLATPGIVVAVVAVAGSGRPSSRHKKNEQNNLVVDFALSRD